MNGRGQLVRCLVLAVSVLAMCGYAAGANTQPKTGQATGSDTQSFERLASRAQAAMAGNRVPEAIRLYGEATAVRPSWSEGWWCLGTLYFDNNQMANARNAFLRFVSVEHGQPGPGYGMLGLSEYQLKNYPLALAAFERGRQLGLGDNPDFVHRVLYLDGVVNNFLGHPEVALVRLTLVANQLAAGHAEAPRQTVIDDLELLDAFGLAALRIQKLPQDLSGDQRSLVRQAGHAQALIALQDRTTAGTELKHLVAQHPSDPGVHYMYGVYLLKEDPPSAMGEFRREIEVSPRSAAAYIQVALGHLENAEFKQGLPYAQKATALAPDNFVAHVACGRLQLGLGDTRRAIRELRTAVRLSPGSPDAHFALSRALTEAGSKNEAARERKEFERLKAISNAADR